MNGALCTCGHRKASHRHYRRGTDCGLCSCQKFRAPPFMKKRGGSLRGLRSHRAGALNSREIKKPGKLGKLWKTLSDRLSVIQGFPAGCLG